MVFNAHQEDDFTKRVFKFRLIAEQVAEKLRSFGLETQPFHNPFLPAYRRLDYVRQVQALRGIETFEASLDSCASAGVDFRRNVRSLWFALRCFSFRPLERMFDHIRSEDVVEIYSAEGIQIWRNFNFMAICSYSLEDMFCHSWQDCYARADSDTQTILQAVTKVLDPNNRGMVAADIPYHSVAERFSPRCLQYQVCHDNFFPLFNTLNGPPVAFVVTSDVKIVGGRTEGFHQELHGLGTAPAATDLHLVIPPTDPSHL